ncbi:hypothetical protein WISP_99904 [Willisornis vidua]|uniref:Uncharacterized protein n=1 Tax=Willisornis vidua TaxID=1566151 RepID=A0ABQ9CZY9_9PASS|nr:hypothetical protein WISP_99904 [Willisornis vidua]
MLLDLVLTKKEGLFGYVKTGDSLGSNDHQMAEIRILHGGSREISRIKTLDIRRANFILFKNLLGGTPQVSSAKASPQESQALKERDSVLPLPLVEDWVRDHLGKSDTHRFMGFDEMQPLVLKEWADAIARPLSITLERS